MTKFLNDKFKSIAPYNTGGDIVPEGCIRLNTNENPYPPSPLALKRIQEIAQDMNYYCDPDCKKLAQKSSEIFRISPDEILFGNGSDEILNFLFAAMCQNGAAFPDITYSFYKVLAEFHGVDVKIIPLKNFKIIPEDYFNLNSRTAFITNPNAPTGLALAIDDIKNILEHNPESLIVIDEAYVDFGASSCVDLIHEYNNLVIVRTFSKSRSLAGGRLGFCMACKDLIQDLKNIKNSLAPYNINALTQAAGLGILEDEEYTRKNINEICKAREFTKNELEKTGFNVLDSLTNFLFVRHEKFSGEFIFKELIKHKVLIRHFNKPEIISDYNRITIGTPEQMILLLEALKNALR